MSTITRPTILDRTLRSRYVGQSRRNTAVTGAGPAGGRLRSTRHGFLGNVPAPTLATLQADISRGYVRVFVLPVSPPGPDPRVRWIESHCTRPPPPPHRRPVPYADFFCGLATA